MSSLTVGNEAETPLCVFVEPLGEDFWIAPKQRLTFAAETGSPDLEVVWHAPTGASIWLNDADAYGVTVTDESGTVVECGYQRPPGAFEAPST